jgi:hypothetical protein
MNDKRPPRVVSKGIKNKSPDLTAARDHLTKARKALARLGPLVERAHIEDDAKALVRTIDVEIRRAQDQLGSS